MQIDNMSNYFLSNDEGSNNFRLESHLDFLKSNTVYNKTEEKINNMSDEDAMQLNKEICDEVKMQLKEDKINFKRYKILVHCIIGEKKRARN